jgi:hypothetical protein
MSKKFTPEEFARKMFSRDEIKNRIALNTVKMIVGDVITLYGEFRKVQGLGALFFNPSAPEKSQFMTITDIRDDISLAEELLDDDLKNFLTKLINVINRESENDKPVIVMLDDSTMSIHVVDIDLAQKRIDDFSNAFSGD